MEACAKPEYCGPGSRRPNGTWFKLIQVDRSTSPVMSVLPSSSDFSFTHPETSWLFTGVFWSDKYDNVFFYGRASKELIAVNMSVISAILWQLLKLNSDSRLLSSAIISRISGQLDTSSDVRELNCNSTVSTCLSASGQLKSVYFMLPLATQYDVAVCLHGGGWKPMFHSNAKTIMTVLCVMYGMVKSVNGGSRYWIS